MAVEYLGTTFDLHGGGLDLVFPHHENENAQSTAAGHGFAQHWLHHGLVTAKGGEKMSKSLGNSVTVEQALRDVPAAGPALRPRRRPLPLHDRVVRAGRRGGDRGLRPDRDLRPQRHRRRRRDPGRPGAEQGVLGRVRRRARRRPRRPRRRSRRSTTAYARATPCWPRVSSRRWRQPFPPYAGCWVFCAWIRSSDWPSQAGGELTPVVDALVSLAVEARAAARERKDWAQADALRDRLADSGIVLEDTADGVRWRLRMTGKSRSGPAKGGQGGRGAKPGSHRKGAAVGSGGLGKQKLEGKKPTPPAELRKGHPKARKAAAAAKRAAAPAPRSAPSRSAAAGAAEGQRGAAQAEPRPAGDGGRPQPGRRVAAGEGAGDGALRRARATTTTSG